MDGVVELVRRCAWCLRVIGDSGWEAPDVEAHDADHETATICPDCVVKLTEAGLSRDVS